MKQESFLESEKSTELEPIIETHLPQISVDGYLEDLKERPHFSVEANFMFLPIFSFDKKSADKRSKLFNP